MYHFFIASKDPKVQAKNFLDLTRSTWETNDLPPVLDLEKSLEYEEESNKKDLKEEYDKLKNYIYEQKIDEKKVFKNFFRVNSIFIRKLMKVFLEKK